MRRILIVDEDVNYLAIVKSSLRRHHYNVIVTTACGEVPDILFFFTPDVIFLTISHGREDQRTLCRQLQLSAEYHEIPLILVFEDEEVSKGFRDLGARGFLKRPAETTEWVAAAQSHFKRLRDV